MKNKFKLILKLFLTFLKIGAFTFGGGYAMIPLIQRETVENNKWISDDDILEIIAVAESTPGPIAINSATFVGYKVCGFWGSFAATLGVVLPSFIIILVISRLLREFGELKAVKYAFNGIRAGVLALLIKSVITMYKKVKKDIVSYAVMIFAFIVAAFFDISILIVIALCAVIGLISSLYEQRRNKI